MPVSKSKLNSLIKLKQLSKQEKDQLSFALKEAQQRLESVELCIAQLREQAKEQESLASLMSDPTYSMNLAQFRLHIEDKIKLMEIEYYRHVAEIDQIRDQLIGALGYEKSVDQLSLKYRAQRDREVEVAEQQFLDDVAMQQWRKD